MIAVETAIRAWVEVEKPQHQGKGGSVAFRPQPYGQRVLVFDTETTTDPSQHLLFGFFRIYERDRLILEGIIVADVLGHEARETIIEYAARCRLPIYDRERFVEEVFYPEVYELGTLCVGFNLPFDLVRIARSAGCGRGKNRRKFKIVLSRRRRWHDLRIESASGHAAFIGFVPKSKLHPWEKPFFKGRFLDLSTLTRAFTGESHSLKSACETLKTHTRKMDIDELGIVNRRTLTYGRQDVRATWALYRKLRTEYTTHPFATFENELNKSDRGLYMGAVYSSASIAKQYLRLLGFRPLLEAQPDFDRRLLGHAAAAFFGGRSEVRVRKCDVPVAVVDFTSMYPTVIINQDLQALLLGKLRADPVPIEEIEAFLASLTPEKLYDPKTWPMLNCLVLVEPNGTILPTRMRLTPEERQRRRLPDSWGIAVTPLEATGERWYVLADIVAGMLLGAKAWKLKRAIRFVAESSDEERSELFRGRVPLSTKLPILRTLVEERQRARDERSADPELAPLQAGLKITANSMYGIFAEVNVTPHKLGKLLPGHVYADTDDPCPNVHDERPGAYSNPIIASLITGGARLMLALLEYEVQKRGGTFVFCDTDSLAIVCGKRCRKDVPCLSEGDVDAIITRFDALNPYGNVPHLLKREYKGLSDLRCFAISAKRYVLHRWRAGRRIQIVKASESGLGAMLGRTKGEKIAKLARRMWLTILMKELPRVNAMQRLRAEPLVDFHVPLRRKFPISQPSILRRFAAYNRAKTFEERVKPYNFVQSVTPAVITGKEHVLPIAPHEDDLAKSKRLMWIDYHHSGKAVRLDWSGEGFAGTIPVMRIDEFIEAYRRHAEWKAADQNGNPAGEEAIGCLGRLTVQAEYPARIGKEGDRLDQDEGATLEGEQPIEYEHGGLADAVAFLGGFPQRNTARDIDVSDRRWRDIVKGRAKPHPRTARRIQKVAEAYRLAPTDQPKCKPEIHRSPAISDSAKACSLIGVEGDANGPFTVLPLKGRALRALKPR